MKIINWFLLVIISIIVGYYVYECEADYRAQKKNERTAFIMAEQEHAIKNIEAAVTSYYMIVAAVKTFAETFETKIESEDLQKFIQRYSDKVAFKDSILLSFIDTNHQFVYTIGPHQIDPVGLSGFNVSWFRTDKEIDYLDSVMYKESISLGKPINLAEGWPAFPFSFNLKTENGTVYGYLAAVLDIQYLTDIVYKNNHDSRVLHRFMVNDSSDFTNVAVYDGSTIYNEEYDSLYYKNSSLNSNDFIYSDYELFDRNFTIGTAVKGDLISNSYIKYLFEAYLVFTTIVMLLFLSISLKN